MACRRRRAKCAHLLSSRDSACFSRRHVVDSVKIKRGPPVTLMRPLFPSRLPASGSGPRSGKQSDSGAIGLSPHFQDCSQKTEKASLFFNLSA